MLPLRLATLAVLALVACNDPFGPGTNRPWGPGHLTTGGSSGGTTSTQVASVAIAPASAQLVVGDSVRLVATAADQNGLGITGVTFSWATTDARIARVRAEDTNGTVAVVTAVALGTATVTLSSGSASATATVTVVTRP